MSDEELRDKLASEGIVSEMSGELIPRWHVADFKAGWNAARANPLPGHALVDIFNARDRAENDAANLRAEVERRKADWQREHTAKVDAKQERDWLKAEVEAFKILLNDSQHKSHVCGDEDCPVKLAEQALADYEKFKKENE